MRTEPDWDEHEHEVEDLLDLGIDPDFDAELDEQSRDGDPDE